ncbi:MAG: EFR1 family ferrodoxin [Lentimicrobiaceae bacterium]|nr:EFR1 family ferrodoxin [Lentimicrobiaceae bacterium]
MNGIFYFSSTGNSLYIAEQIKAELGGEIRFIPKFKDDVNNYDKIIIVSPIHSFGLPTLVYNFIDGLKTSKPLYIVLNHGGMEAFAPYYAYQVCKEKGLNIRSVQAVMMPEIYTLTFSQPKFLINMVLRKAPKRIKPVIEVIREDKEIVIPKPEKDKWTPKHLENRKIFHKLVKDFKITEKCTDCGKCIRICPVNNIKYENGEIIFGDKCVACLSCYHRCPEKAIQYKNKRKKDRYINPLIQEKNIGADQM